MMGCDIERIEDDHIDIEFFPNRPDLYSTEGVARALKGFLDMETGAMEFNVTPSVCCNKKIPCFDISVRILPVPWYVISI